MNNIENTFVQPSGGSETGDYYLTSAVYTSGGSIGGWYASLSKGQTPVSITTDESLQAHSGCNAISSDHLGQYGVHIYTTSTAITAGANVGGVLTFNY